MGGVRVAHREFFSGRKPTNERSPFVEKAELARDAAALV